MFGVRPEMDFFGFSRMNEPNFGIETDLPQTKMVSEYMMYLQGVEPVNFTGGSLKCFFLISGRYMSFCRVTDTPTLDFW